MVDGTEATDAVNKGQLMRWRPYQCGNASAVSYDDASKDQVTLGGNGSLVSNAG